MKMAKALFIFASTCMLLAGCGPKRDLGENVNFLVLPEKVIVGPGPMRSCVDTVNGAITASVQGPLIFFPKLRLDWTSKEHFLLISSIRVTVTGFGIKEGKYQTLLSPEEIAAMIGASIPPDRFVDTTNRTEDDPRGIDRNRAPCGLLVGGLPLVNGNATPSFRARVKVDIIGTSLSSDYTEQLFVRQTVYGSADYIKF